MQLIRWLFPILVLLAGCQAEHIPTYPSMPPQQALAAIAERSRAIKTVSAQGLVTLTRADGNTIRLDAAMAIQLPDSARIRTWKFGQAVFDLTLTDQGVWIIAPPGDAQKEITAAGANMAKIMRQWLRILTGGFDGPGVTVEAAGSRLIIRQQQPDGTMLVCEVDAATLTAREYTLQDKTGDKFQLKLGDYAEFNGIVWPTRIEAVSKTGRVLVELRDVEINGEIPAGAFNPPARAEKLP